MVTISRLLGTQTYRVTHGQSIVSGLTTIEAFNHAQSIDPGLHNTLITVRSVR